MAEISMAVKNTATKFLKGAIDQTIRGRFWLAWLREHGRIKLGDRGGVSCTWNVKAKEPEIRQYGDGGHLEFAQHDAYEQLTVDIRGYSGTDRITMKAKLMNSGELAIVDLYGTKLQDLLSSITNKFGGEIYVDGYAANNTNRLCGLNSFMGTGTTVAADIVAQPSDTYAGKSTALANLGGSWSTNLTTSPNANAATDWPEGSGSSEYDYLAPKIVNYSSSSWGTGSTTWADNCSKVLRRARIWTQNTAGTDMAPMLHLLSPTLYAGFEDYMEAKFSLVMPHVPSQELGFADALNYSGAVVKQDHDCPADEGYGINADQMLLFSLTDDLFYYDQWESKESNSDLFKVGFFGNMRFNCKAFSKYKDVA